VRIGFIEPHLKIFGGIRRIVELSNRLVRRGHDVTIYHPAGTPCEWMESLASTRPAESCLQTPHDVIVYNDPNPHDYRLAHRAPARLRVFFVLELYEIPLLTGFHPTLYRPRNQRTRYMRRSLRSSAMKLTNATWLSEWLRERMNIDSELLIGGVNTEMFHPVEVPRDPRRVVVLCSGDPRKRKGTGAIEQAVEIAARRDPRIELATYHGRGIPQSSMAQTYCGADLFVEASWQAGWNNPVVEAMACGVPVVCTAIGGVRDFALHERTALLVPPRDPEALAEAILRMVEDRALRERLREEALRTVRAFSWDESAARMEAIFERALGEGGNDGA